MIRAAKIQIKDNVNVVTMSAKTPTEARVMTIASEFLAKVDVVVAKIMITTAMIMVVCVIKIVVPVTTWLGRDYGYSGCCGCLSPTRGRGKGRKQQSTSRNKSEFSYLVLLNFLICLICICFCLYYHRYSA